MKKQVLLFLFLLVISTSFAQTLVKEFPNLQGAVLSTARSGDTLFLAGSFIKIYEPDALSTNLARFNTTTGAFFGGRTTLTPPVLPGIHDAISDGRGGFYICSNSSITWGDSVRGKLVHIDSTGQVTTKFKRLLFSVSAPGNGLPAKLALKDNILYVGGTFYGVQDSAGYQFNSGGNAFSLSDGNVHKGFPKVNGLIQSVIPDKQGGWYIGGSFSLVDTFSRIGVAHIDSAGRVLPWNPNFSSGSMIQDLTLSDSGTLYIAGGFIQVNGQSRRYLIEVDTVNGTLTSWNPQIDNMVFSVVVKDSLVYAYGAFNNAGGQARTRLAAINRTSGLASSLNVGITGVSTFTKLAIKDSLLFVAGNFTNVGGLPRSGLASINILSGTVTNWNPTIVNGAGSSIFPPAMMVHGQRLYVAGTFALVNDSVRSGLASFDIVSGNPTSWNPNVNFGTNAGPGAIGAFAPYGNKIAISGGFYVAGGMANYGIALLDTATGLSAKWNAFISSPPRCMAISGNKVYTGGPGAQIAGGRARISLVALNVNTEEVIDWSPGTELSAINKILPTDSVVYVAGTFKNIGGEKRSGLVGISAQTGLASLWKPDSIPFIAWDLAVKDSLLYVAGDELMSLSTITGVRTSWNPAADAQVRCMIIKNNKLFVGGNFNTIAGMPRTKLAAIDLATGLPDAWNPDVAGSITAMAFNDSVLYLAGIGRVMGKTRIGLAAVNPYTNKLLDWNPGPSSGPFNSICFSGNTGCIAGTFSNVGGKSVKGLAAVNLVTNEIIAWQPEVTGSMMAIAVRNNKVYLGGSFTAIEGVSRVNFAVVDKQTGAVDSFQLSPNNIVNRFYVKDSILYAGGNFTSIGGYLRAGIAGINLSAGNITPFSITGHGPINAIYLSDSLLYTGGSFTKVGGITRNRLASFRLSDGSLTSWNPDVNGDVRAMDMSGNLLFIGGSFTTVNSTSRNGLAALNPVSGALNGWNIQLDNYVSGFHIKDNKMYATGGFVNVGGATRYFAASIRLDSAVATSWDAASGGLGGSSLVIATDNKVIISGNINAVIQGERRMAIAVFASDTTNVTLPVKLLNFTAKKRNDKHVELTWTTASEQNNSHFIVERSDDMKKFESIARVKSSTNSSKRLTYTANDRRYSNEKVIYYRLKQVDLDGTETLSPLISVNFEDAEEIALYPNPSNGLVYLHQVSSYTSEVKIHDLHGRTVKQFELLQNGVTAIDCSDLQQGIYIVQVSNEAGVKMQRLMISK